MKTYQTNPSCSIDDFLAIENATIENAARHDGGVGHDFTVDLFLEYERALCEAIKPKNLMELRKQNIVFASRFLFECGRIYGIRQERARRKGSHQR